MVGETIYIGDDVVIHVTRTGKDKTRIGIDAPPHVKVLRGELRDGPRPLAEHEDKYGKGARRSLA
jgi:carbon storage regulator